MRWQGGRTSRSTSSAGSPQPPTQPPSPSNSRQAPAQLPVGLLTRPKLRGDGRGHGNLAAVAVGGGHLQGDGGGHGHLAGALALGSHVLAKDEASNLQFGEAWAWAPASQSAVLATRAFQEHTHILGCWLSSGKTSPRCPITFRAPPFPRPHLAEAARQRVLHVPALHRHLSHEVRRVLPHLRRRAGAPEPAAAQAQRAQQRVTRLLALSDFVPALVQMAGD